jgi:uracil-DNA glycosylase
MFQDIYNRFKLEKIGENEFCTKCRLETDICTTPLSPYLISDNFTNPNERIMFVGKTARGCDFGNETDSFYENVLEFGNDFIRNNSWSFFSYTREIILRYFKDLEEGLKKSSYSNLMKCNNESTQDTTQNLSKELCLNSNKFIWKEINIIKPKRIIFYSHYYYDSFIDNFKPENCCKIIDKTSQENTVPIGQKFAYHWHREFYDKEGKFICAFLRTSHPERLNKNDFVNNVLKFLIETENK